MKMIWWRVGVAVSLLGTLVASGCTGGKESNAAEEQLPKKNPIVVSQTQPATPSVQPPAPDVRQQIKSLSSAIPIYAGAQFRDDLTRRDEIMIRNQYGPQARVYTLATNDSYPQVYHYYTTYLAQFRAYPPQSPYPPEQQTWRTIDVNLNQAMQDPFIPGDTIEQNGKQVILQVAETEAEPRTVIRYIVAPAAAVPRTAQAAPPRAVPAAASTVTITHGNPATAALR
jgi:hypothetical protein